MKKCIIIINRYRTSAFKIAEEISEFLSEKHIDVSKITFSEDSQDFDCQGYDAAITLGGDGTVLYAARKCSLYGIPVFPINLGQFGFIAGISPHEWREQLQSFIDGNVSVDERKMLNAGVYRNGVEIYTSAALNDAVIKASGYAKLAELEISCNNYSFGRFRADGLIAATPTGSTAYSAAAGGPIADPTLDVIIMSPVCPFSLSNRPIVLSGDSVLKITVKDSRGADIVLTCDGQESFSLLPEDVVIIKRNAYSARLAGCGKDIFYAALKSKLNWSGGPHA